MTTTLTTRQRAILQHLADGMTVEQMSDAVHLAATPIRETLADLRAIFDAKTNPHLAAIAVREGIIN